MAESIFLVVALVLAAVVFVSSAVLIITTVCNSVEAENELRSIRERLAKLEHDDGASK